MKWAGHVARMEEERKRTRFWWERPKERDNLEDRGVDGTMGSEWILGCGVDTAGWGQGPVTDSYEHGDEPSGSGATQFVWKCTEVDVHGNIKKKTCFVVWDSKFSRWY
jgi:hypothetical protein